MRDLDFFNILDSASHGGIVGVGTPIHIITLLFAILLIFSVYRYNNFFVKYEKIFFTLIVLTAWGLELYYNIYK